MKAIHNRLNLSAHRLRAVVSDVKDTENESNSQQFWQSDISSYGIIGYNGILPEYPTLNR